MNNADYAIGKVPPGYRCTQCGFVAAMERARELVRKGGV